MSENTSASKRDQAYSDPCTATSHDRMYWIGPRRDSAPVRPEKWIVVVPDVPVHGTATTSHSVTYRNGFLPSADPSWTLSTVTALISEGLNHPTVMHSKHLTDIREGKFPYLSAEPLRLDNWKKDHVTRMAYALSKHKTHSGQLDPVESLVLSHPSALDTVKDYLGFDKSVKFQFYPGLIEFVMSSSPSARQDSGSAESVRGSEEEQEEPAGPNPRISAFHTMSPEIDRFSDMLEVVARSLCPDTSVDPDIATEDGVFYTSARLVPERTDSPLSTIVVRGDRSVTDTDTHSDYSTPDSMISSEDEGFRPDE